MNGINTLNVPTINGLRSLTLDEINTGDLTADNIYLENVETSDLIIDNQITMLNNSVINAGGAVISDDEISYLDNVTSNIQAQIDDTVNETNQVSSTGVISGGVLSVGTPNTTFSISDGNT